MYLDHAALMENLGWHNAFFSMHHPQNFSTPWETYFVDELEFGNSYGVVDKAIMASKVIYSFEAQNKLKRLLQDYPADVAHLHCIYHHLSPAILPTLHEHGVPIIMTAHDLKIACPAYKMLNETGICEKCKDGNFFNVIKHKCLRNSLGPSVIVALESTLHHKLNTYKKYLTKVAVPSRFFMNKFVEWGWPEDKFSYIPNYVDSLLFTPEYAPGDYFLYFGRLAPEKGVTTLLKAVKKSGVKLKVAGTGPEEAKLHALQNELQADVEFLGYQSGDALHTLIKQSKAIVLPSEWYENAPMSLLESMAFGKPLVVANIGGIPEMIESGETGWMFTSCDIDELADLLTSIEGTSDDKLLTYGKASRALVEERFNRDNYVSAIQNLYASVGVRV
ncbi:glycosyltransferase family 4 protein [Methylobacillus caricis]|nr:glycosyltransferase family 4 protein [Methylobacillus caricis]MCB5188072.1 glycosyltransferase family 4 protein [Methylobacillus caricis]